MRERGGFSCDSSGRQHPDIYVCPSSRCVSPLLRSLPSFFAIPRLRRRLSRPSYFIVPLALNFKLLTLSQINVHARIQTCRYAVKHTSGIHELVTSEERTTSTFREKNKIVAFRYITPCTTHDTRYQLTNLIWRNQI